MIYRRGERGVRIVAVVAALLVFRTIALADGKSPPRAEVRTPYEIVDEEYEYRYIWRQGAPAAPGFPDSLRAQGRPFAFNWIARRDPCFLVSGDLPRLALARTFPEASACPPIAKLGDLRIRCRVAGKSFWLDEAKDITAYFHPWGTIHSVSLKPDAPLGFTVRASLATNRGIAVQVQVAADSDQPVDVVLELFYGGVHQKGRPTDVPPYFHPTDDPAEAQDDTVTLEPSGATLADPKIPVTAVVLADPAGETSVQLAGAEDGTGNRAVFSYRFAADRTPRTLRILAFEAEPGRGSRLEMNQFDSYVRGAQQYYDALLAPYEIRTPDEVLDAGFYAAIVNLDYVYQPPAWLEGVHWWNAWWCNNYQISAAICLNQLARARDALRFFAARPGGPVPIVQADGSSASAFDDGLLYYIQELCRYWLVSGDMETLDKVWAPTAANLEKLLQVRDPEGNLLLNFHQGCNAFLYQADHLSLPGDAFSPSVMAADCLDKMADLADARGEKEQALRWRHRAEYMRGELLRRLWSPEQGKFTACLDTQGLPMQANYYTDFVFPQLYSSLPAEHSWISLKTLDRTLWVGDHLMRVGNLTPPLFGNDNVMPVQMAEAAEAYCRAGRSQEGHRLLYGTALAATAYTDSPGSFPERMSDGGFGRPDFAFGNPTGSFIRAVVSGLFGLERASADRALPWHPSLPDDWAAASLRVDDVAMATSGAHGDRTYSITLPKPQALDLEVALHGHRVEKVLDAAGHEVRYAVSAHPSGGLLRLHSGPATHHELRVISRPAGETWTAPAGARSGSEVRWKLPSPGMSVLDPHGVFERFQIAGDELRGRLAQATGPRTFFLCHRQRNSEAPVELDFAAPAKRPWQPLVLLGKREHLSLAGQFNSDVMLSRNHWYLAPITIDIAGHTVRRGEQSFLAVGDYEFEVTPSGRNVVLLTVGELDSYTQSLKLSDKPSALVLEVGKPVRGLEFLLASEWLVRHTGAQVGCITLHYGDGSCQTEPLVHGRNIGSVYAPIAAEAAHLELQPQRSIDAFAVQADPSRRLDSLEIRLYAADGNIAIFGINLVVPR